MPMVERPTPRRGISDIAAYVPGKASAPGAEKIYKLSSNESALGVSSAAAKAFADEATNLQDYPDGSASNLRQALAIRHGINADRIICGNGSDEILSLVASTFLEPGDEAIHCEHGFLVYPIAIRASGATPVVAQEKSYAADIDAILAAVTAKTKLVFLANPNNPTGTYVPFSEVQRLHAALPNQTLLVLDAAYAEFVRKNDYQAGIELAGSAENVLMTRTFSKIYGLAGARLGWAYGAAHIIDMMHRVRGPFNVNRAAIAAGVASLNDREFLDRSIEHNEKWLPWCKDQLQAFGLEVTPSIGNFLLIHFPDIQGKRAADADAFLLKKGVILRQVTNYGLPNALRMSIGSEEANRTAISFIGEFLAH